MPCIACKAVRFRTLTSRCVRCGAPPASPLSVVLGNLKPNCAKTVDHFLGYSCISWLGTRKPQAAHPDNGGVQCAHGKQSSHGGFSSVNHCIIQLQWGVLHVINDLVFCTWRGFFSAFSATRLNAACFMHWLGLLDVLRKGAAFSLRNNDAETFDLARSSVVGWGNLSWWTCRDYHHWFSNVVFFLLSMFLGFCWHRLTQYCRCRIA